MSTGISISSINRIKELAEEKKYAEALKILDTQNLDKSINPQFLRISGEIFRENKRYYDSRRILLKSHQMSPQGTRIIFELIQLHLELGHFSIAEKYYEQYQFYSSEEDTLKDYVEYSMKKATGADVKELASILIPILERMPEDRWNFEAVLLYDKLDRKDKALEESQYILENFKNSIYIQPVIQYIDDTLDVDRYFYVYPREPQEDQESIFGELIAQEEELLKADYLRMYPPEPRIMLDAEDKDPIEPKPTKEKKKKKRKQKQPTDGQNETDVSELSEDMGKTEGTDPVLSTDAADEQSEVAQKEAEKEKLRQEREHALEKLLSKKIDKDKIKESAKQVAQAVKEIDTEKAKSQVKSVAESMKDNMKKATDVLGEAVGVSAVSEQELQDAQSDKAENAEEQILDGIIEEVLEAPKQTVGQVVTNEELDTLIPNSLEAMSADEIAEARRKAEEAQRAAEEALKHEEKPDQEVSETDSNPQTEAEAERDEATEDTQSVQDEKEFTFDELKARYYAEQEDMKPLDSLGFISVVQSDVDSTLQENAPDLANMLHQMIDNKEYYTGEDSSHFESKASYDNHGFEVEDYDFEDYKEAEEADLRTAERSHEEFGKDVRSVEVIYAQEAVVDFNEIVPESDTGDEILEENAKRASVFVENTENVAEQGMEVVEHTSMEHLPEQTEPVMRDETAQESVVDPFSDQKIREAVGRAVERRVLERENLRVRILLSDSMVRKLLDLKESR